MSHCLFGFCFSRLDPSSYVLLLRPPLMSSSYVLLLCPFCFYVEDLSLRIHLWHVAGRKPSRTPECLSGDKITGNHAPGPLDAHIWSCFWLWFGCRSASPYFLVSAFYFFYLLEVICTNALGCFVKRGKKYCKCISWACNMKSVELIVGILRSIQSTLWII